MTEVSPAPRRPEPRTAWAAALGVGVLVASLGAGVLTAGQGSAGGDGTATAGAVATSPQSQAAPSVLPTDTSAAGAGVAPPGASGGATWRGAERPPPGAGASATPLGAPPAVEVISVSYTFDRVQADGVSPVGFDPCRPLRYVVRPDGEPEGARPLIDAAFAALSGATGLRQEYVGETDEEPRQDRPPYQPERYGQEWAPVLVAWSSAAEDAALAGGTLGVTTTISARGGGPSTYITGMVLLDGEDLAHMLEYQGEQDVLGVLLHELGHLAGLAHVADPSQLMSAQNRPGLNTYQPGDLTGLALLGGTPCVPEL